jgi:hypothetical protein
MAAAERQRAFISTTTAADEANHADDEAQAGHSRRDSGRGIHAADGADFWLNVQRRSDLWEAMNSPRERERIERAKPLGAAA